MEVLNFKFRYDSDCWVDGYKTSCEHEPKIRKLHLLLECVLITAFLVYLGIDFRGSENEWIFWVIAGFFILIMAWLLISSVLSKRKRIAFYSENLSDTVFAFKLYDDRFSFEALEPEDSTDTPEEDGAHEMPEDCAQDSDDDAVGEEESYEEVTMLDEKGLWAVEKDDYFGLFLPSPASMCIIPKAGLDSYECGQLSDLVRRINENK